MESSVLATAAKTNSQLTVQLHPLVLLTISDYVTRHILRRHTTPIAGAIIGQQLGREVTMEYAFECKLIKSEDGSPVFDDEWFRDRLQQYRDVHKNPPLDLVGWFTLGSEQGPQSACTAIQQQLLKGYNESVLLLSFHPTAVLDNAGSRSERLPLTIYESSSADDENSSIRFHELPYVVETGEAEMIGVDSVASGGANATLAPPSAEKKVAKGKSRASRPAQAQDGEALEEFEYLSQEDQDAIANLTTKANAIRMLQKRITFMRTYLEALPPCYLTDDSLPTSIPDERISHVVLRSISGLLSRLALLKSSVSPETLEAEQSRQAADVALVSLLGGLGGVLQSASEFGSKSALFDVARAMRRPRGDRHAGRKFYAPPGEDESLGDEL